MEKLFAMQIAAQLTSAACTGAGGNLPVSPDLADNAVRAKNLHVWETFRVFYHATHGALKDSQSWPAPDSVAGKVLPDLLAGIAPILNQPAVQDLVQRLLGLIPKPTPQPSAPLPNPGN
jgi:hypothetical protein